MKLTENKAKTISLRISEKDYKYLTYASYIAGMTTSKYIRTLCDATINAVKIQEAKGVIKSEDIETVCNDKL